MRTRRAIAIAIFLTSCSVPALANTMENLGGAVTFNTAHTNATDPGGITVTGSGTLTFNNSGNTYSGVTEINSANATVQGAGVNYLSPNSQFVISTGTLNLNGFNQTIGSLTGVSGTVINNGGTAATLTTGGDNTTTTYFGSIQDGASTLALVKNGTGTMTLSGPNTYTGGTTVNRGTLQVTGLGTLGDTHNSIGVSGGTLDLGGTIQTQDGGVTLVSGTIQNGILSSANGFDVQSGTVSATLAGSGNLRMSPSGTVTLSSNNTYTGGTIITGGVLSISSDANLGNGGTVTMTGGGTLAFTATGSYSHALTLSVDNSFDVASGQTVTYTAAISDGALQGTLEKTDSGTLILAVANNYSAGTIIDAGVVQIGNNNALGSGTVTLNGGVLKSGGGVAVTIPNPVIVGSNGGTLDATLENLSIPNGIAGAGDLTFAGGTTTLSAANTYTGATIISGGRLVLGATGSISSSSGVSLTASGTTFDVSGASTSVTIKGLSGVAGSQVVLGSGQDLDINTSGSSTFAGTISDNGNVGSVTVFGTGTLTLSGANAFLGEVLVNANLVAANASALGQGPVSVEPGVTLTISNVTVTAGTIAVNSGATLTGIGVAGINEPVFLAGGTIGVPNAGDVFTLSDTVSEVSSGTVLTKVGSGTLVLSASNTYTGGTTVSAGTLQIASIGTLGAATGSLTVSGGSTLDLGNSLQVQNGGVTLTSGTIQNGALSTSGTFNVQSGTVAAVLDGSGTLDKTTSGTVTLSTTNTYTGGTTIEAGTLSISSDTDLGIGAVTMDAGSTLAFTAGGTYSRAVTLAGDPAFDVAAGQTVTYSAVIADGASAGTLEKTDSGTLILTAANTYSGGTSVSGGTLQVAGSGTLGATSGSVTVSGGTLDLGGTTQTQNGGVTLTSGIIQNGTLSSSGTFTLSSGTVSAVLAGTGGLTKTTSATVTLSGINTYTGETIINAPGTLALSGAGSISSSSDVAVHGTFDISATTAGTSIKDLFSLDSTSSVVLGGKTLTITNGVTGSGTSNFSGNISGSGSVTISGGSETFSGVNGYTGATTIANGATLAMGGSSVSIAASSGVVDNGTFNLNGIGNSIKSITGSGAVIGGSLTLTNASGTFSGSIGSSGDPIGLTIAGGNQTLSGTAILSSAAINSGATLALSGAATVDTTVADNGTLDISAKTSGASVDFLNGSGTVVLGSQTLTFTNLAGSGATSTFSGVIQGSGGLVITGGTGGSGANRILAGNNTYTGTTTIQSGGILQLGNGGTSGSVAGAITDNGTLEFNRSDSVTYAGVISGSGAVNQIGSGTLILSGANTYSGGTAVSGGTLQVTTTSLQGNITLNSGAADVAFNQSGAGTYAGTIIGLGTMSIAGTGDVTFTGTNTYSGATTVSAGTLTVMGSLAGPVTVNGGKLAGTGTVGAVNVASGTLAPGDAIGTLHVNGNVALGTGTTYAVEVSPTVADETIATGAVTIGSNTILAVTQDAGTYSAHDYTLISAASISGTFTTVTGETFSGLNSTVQYSATGVDLILSEPPPPAPVTFLFGTYGQTPNQTAVGEAVTAGPATGGLYTSLGSVVTTNTSAVPATLAQLSGDIHASLRSAMIEDGKIIRDTVINHAIAGGDAITVWGAGFGAYGTIDGGTENADLHHNDSGVIVGADMPVMDGINVGLGTALTGQRIAVPSEASSANGSTNHVIGYANWTDSQWMASLGWDYGWGANQVTRQITAFSETDTDHQSNKLSQVFGEVGYRIPSEVIALEPYLDLANVSARTGAFSETGGIAALDGGAKSGGENYSTLGLRATLPAISLAGISMVPDFNLGWQHAFNRFISTQTLAFAGTGESFAISGVPLDTDAAAMQVGLDFLLAPNVTLDIGYDGNVSSRVQDHAVRGDLAWRF